MMQAENSQRNHSTSLVRVLLLLLSSDWLDALETIWRLGRRMLALRIHEGIYEVLEYESRLEIADTKGEKAVLHKRERVRFLQDNIMAYQDQAWGDGVIFADYRCSPGVAVDRYREGHLYRILISLRETKSRGDIEEFHIQRTIKRGFTKPVEDFQIEINHTTRKLSVSVVFPRNRVPKRVTLIEKNIVRVTELGTEYRVTLPDGRQQYLWQSDHPRVFEAYILRWEW
jgi:hypothetical protein